MARPTRASIDLAALRSNLALARSLAGDARLMAVVKANAYGHGAVSVARALDAAVDAMAVACIEEALELRRAGVAAPILLLEGLFERDELALAAAEEFWLTVDNRRQLEWLERASLARPVRCWLKLDTGMHRLGIPVSQAAEFLTRLRAAAAVHPEVVLSTHFACADEPGNPHTRRQIALFESITAGLGAPRSACNSAGLLAWPEARYDWVRPGYMLYGNSPFTAPVDRASELRPVMTLEAQVISLRTLEPGESVGYGATWSARRTSRIATVCIGYGDGYPRLAPSGTPVLVNGRRAPLAGRVSMDMVTVDVTDLPDVAIGDEVVLWGPDLTADEVARHAGTIGYELTTRMPLRTPRAVTGD
jgi:alanine racemase